jgi:hypothetical protein
MVAVGHFAGLAKELDQRVFVPLLADPDSVDVVSKSFQAFAELWPAMLSALAPWLQENPESALKIAKLASDVWSTTATATTLNADARYWFAAAQDARTQLAAVVTDGTIQAPVKDEAAITRACLLADFAIMFGLFMSQTSRSIPSGLAEAVGRFAHAHAKEAHVLATAGLVNVDTEIERLLAEIRGITAQMTARTMEAVRRARAYREKWRS